MNTKEVVKAINEFINTVEKPEEHKEILGHKKILFFNDEKFYKIDYAIKRATLATAIDEKEKQKIYMTLVFLLLGKYSHSINLSSYWDFIKSKVSPSVSFNKTEKKYFGFA